ncbi:hypothetical protein N7532_011269 [Penicillium argentinense]|uniref:Uncharacterized protein n=1 Tax=Penicillium argentinense TaxID=1131581 RepID=A0A9W9EIA5_9EURO|nr:uncharacterized protein N7532_011269 [Penicillium argentinense]KAJ5082226.1 hypothetical protein N7532_011269 [Penicillium argentinense]
MLPQEVNTDTVDNANNVVFDKKEIAEMFETVANEDETGRNTSMKQVPTRPLYETILRRPTPTALLDDTRDEVNMRGTLSLAIERNGINFLFDEDEALGVSQHQRRVG